MRTHYIASFRLARDAYTPAFESMRQALEAHEGPVVVHCTAGKDRTGLVAALLLRAVGVDDATIAAEYALLLDAHAQTMTGTLAALDDDLVVIAWAARHLR